jgi:hypothetical protein
VFRRGGVPVLAHNVDVPFVRADLAVDLHQALGDGAEVGGHNWTGLDHGIEVNHSTVQGASSAA